MARPLRLCVPGGIYHLISRGNARGRVYRDDLDRENFLADLEHTVDRFGWRCHAYCLMDNHYHLVAETPHPNLPLGMRQLNGVYASRYNRRHDRCGHVFQARYRSILVEGPQYLVSLCRYVILNPVRAGACDEPQHWRWSSYRATAGLGRRRRFLTTELILGEFGDRLRLAQAGYREFVAAGIGEALEDRIRGERLGGEAFLRDRFGLEPPLPEIPRVQVEPERRPLEEIFSSDVFPVAASYRRYGYSLREISLYLGCHYSTISRRLRREEEAAGTCGNARPDPGT